MPIDEEPGSRRGGVARRFLAIGAVLAIAALSVLLLLNRRVDQALETGPSGERPLEYLALPEPSPLPFWGGEEIESVAILPGGRYVAGAFGVARLVPSPDARALGFDRADISMALPTRRVRVLAPWRTDLVAGLEAGGLFVYRDAAWSEVRSGFGELHVRDLAESPAGELWVGAREGLFRIRFGERVIAQLHPSSVRSIALLPGGGVVSGGETGLFVTEGVVTSAFPMEGTQTPWVEKVAVMGGRTFAATPSGLFAEGEGRVLRPLPGGGNLGSIAARGDRLLATADPPDPMLRQFDSAGRPQGDQLPSRVRRVFAVGDTLFVDTANGLVERINDSWRLIAPRRQTRIFGDAHVGALAEFRGRLVAGFFDGGLSELVEGSRTDPPDDRPLPVADSFLRPITDRSSPIWAVNALLEAGGVLQVASLRGAFRFDGVRAVPVEGTGAAFSLAQTRGGVAIGFGEGVLLPDRKLLSAFHGLPGNQATALASSERGLLVGTPSGLGYIESARVLWRVASGDGKLPHPWVTALLVKDGNVLVGTYGGGLTLRAGVPWGAGEWRPFPETAGLKVNAGCLLEARGRVYAGTDGAGVFRLSRDGTRFDRLKLSLPSPRVTALYERSGFVYIGTDEGLTRWPVDREE